MSVNTIPFIKIEFSKNEFKPPDSVMKITNENDEIIRQIPSESELKFKESINKIDFYI